MKKVRVLKVYGEVEFSRRESIAEYFAKIGKQGTATILDLSRVSFADASFLGAMVGTRNRMRIEQLGSELYVIAPRFNAVRRLLEITNLSGSFALYDNMTSAQDHVLVNDRTKTLALSP